MNSKLLLFSLCFLFFSLNILHGQKDSRAFEQIKNTLLQQQKDWNNGHIDAFMTAYWHSPELQFGGASGITKGWQNTLDGYIERYPNRDAMGKLTFKVKDLTRHSKKVISLTGSWELERKKDRPGGHFLLIWRKIKGHWLIVADHTSSKN